MNLLPCGFDRGDLKLVDEETANILFYKINAFLPQHLGMLFEILSPILNIM